MTREQAIKAFEDRLVPVDFALPPAEIAAELRELFEREWPNERRWRQEGAPPSLMFIVLLKRLRWLRDMGGESYYVGDMIAELEARQ